RVRNGMAAHAADRAVLLPEVDRPFAWRYRFWRHRSLVVQSEQRGPRASAAQDWTGTEGPHSRRLLALTGCIRPPRHALEPPPRTLPGRLLVASMVVHSLADVATVSEVSEWSGRDRAGCSRRGVSAESPVLPDELRCRLLPGESEPV